jgi:hypothetical protein
MAPFFTRSQPGEHLLTKDDYADFATQVPPTSSILPSMRASTSTRDVLTYTGPVFWLDSNISVSFLVWTSLSTGDGDRQLQRKPSHIVDDLLILVGAIGHTPGSDRLLGIQVRRQSR